jgi:uracil phosphoribosyltransferase
LKKANEAEIEDDLVSLCNEALRNSKENRDRLRAFVERLTNMVTDETITDAEAANIASSLCEPIVRAHDTLVKVNSQIIDLAQIKIKQLALNKKKDKGEEESEEQIYGKIGAAFESKAEKKNDA